jgi:hypothetical protein
MTKNKKHDSEAKHGVRRTSSLDADTAALRFSTMKTSNIITLLFQGGVRIIPGYHDTEFRSAHLCNLTLTKGDAQNTRAP